MRIESDSIMLGFGLCVCGGMWLVCVFGGGGGLACGQCKGCLACFSIMSVRPEKKMCSSTMIVKKKGKNYRMLFL